MTSTLISIGLEYWILLLAASSVASFVTAVAGVGGGAFLLLVMADVVPPEVLIPLHGLVQLGSNGNRTWQTRRFIQPRIVLAFAAGALLAAMLAMALAGGRQWRLDWIPLAVAIFILWTCWGPLPSLGFVRSPLATGAGGLLTTAATLVFGATGPLVAAWFGRAFADRWVYTACFSACMSLQHLLKILVFGWLVFSFTPWLPLAALMILAGYLGTRLGLHWLERLGARRFDLLFRVLLTVLALRIAWRWWLPG